MIKEGSSWKNMTLHHFLKSYINFFFHTTNIFFLILKRYKNYLQIIMGVVMVKYPIIAVPRTSGHQITYHDFSSIYNDLLEIPWDLSNDVASINGYTLHGVRRNGENISDIFIRGDYDFLNVAGNDVVDIGGNIGDSSIYFVSKGAKRVICLEPFYDSYLIAQRNIEVNKLSQKIHLLWAACGSSDNPVNNDNIPPTLTLQNIVEAFGIKSGILKIDCEGCEYEVILNCPSGILSLFTMIQIEYHYGYANIKRKLESSGFQVRVKEPRYFKPRTMTEPQCFFDSIKRNNNAIFVGWLFAWRD